MLLELLAEKSLVAPEIGVGESQLVSSPGLLFLLPPHLLKLLQ